jgi:hypothetical protein
MTILAIKAAFYETFWTPSGAALNRSAFQETAIFALFPALADRSGSPKATKTGKP